MPRPAVTEPPAYEEGGVCINVCKRERDSRQCVYREECSNTQDHSYTAWGGGRGEKMHVCKKKRQRMQQHTTTYTASFLYCTRKLG